MSDPRHDDERHDDERRSYQRLDLSPAQRRALLPRPPKGRAPDTTGPEQGWPPRPRGVTKLRVQPLSDSGPTLSKARRTRLREVALQAPEVSALVDDLDRVVHVGAQVMPLARNSTDAPDKNADDAELGTRLFFFDYDRGATVQVTMRGERVEMVESRTGFQPPVAPEEVERAVALARSAPGLAGAVDELIGEAILSQADPAVDPLASHRIVFVGFYRTVGGPPAHAARVDLTKGTVLSTRDFTR